MTRWSADDAAVLRRPFDQMVRPTMRGVTAILAAHWRLRRVFQASARVELQRRYAGSLLGPMWAVLYPLLFLSVYVFLWLVVFRVRFAEAGRLDYVVFVLAGLVPYLFFVESLSAAVVSVRQNMHLVKGVIIPIELIPTRTVAVALAGHAVGVAMLVLLSGVNGTLSARVLLLPAVVGLQVAGLFGVAWIVAPVGVLLPDATYIVNLATTVLMFVLPIAFTPEMVPERFRFVVWGNPLSYMVFAYRMVLDRNVPFAAGPLVVFALLAAAAFLAGAALFARFKHFVVDFE